MSIQWLSFNIRTAPRDVSLLFYSKIKIESDNTNMPEFYYESDMGIIEEEDDRLIIKYDNCYSDWFTPTHYAEINWPDD
jgi:hypothetical protein